MAKAPASQTVAITPLKGGVVSVKIIGMSPLYLNQMSAKARRDMLIGGAKKTASERKNIKHDPESEFRNSIYRAEDGPTAIGFPASAIKAAMATAALVTDGVKKADIQRLVYLPQMSVPIYGLPALKMDIVRSADMARTPDMRTRAYLPQWCSEIDVRFVQPNLDGVSIVNLLANAGMVCGIGDFRQEKGKGSFGTFRVVLEGDEVGLAAWHKIADQGRDAQLNAIANPQAADQATAELWGELIAERMKRAA